MEATDSDATGILIVGGGFSGTALAIACLARGERVTLIERDADLLGRGIAYGRADAVHLLNVRAGGMSPFPSRPHDFAEWLAAEGSGDTGSFAPRATYGRYLRERLDEAQAATGGRLRIVDGDAVSIMMGPEGAEVVLADGRRLAGRAAVLATGNLEPLSPLAVPDDLPAGSWVGDPWGASIADGLEAEDCVVLIGTGLTAVDVALTLDDAGFGGRILALSRRGLAPRAHAAGMAADVGLPPADPAKLFRWLRARSAAGANWRAAVDALRPVTQTLWQRADLLEKRRFLRHGRAWWDVHRHRIAPQIAERLDRMAGEGRLRVAAGRPLSLAAEGAGVRLTYRLRGEDQVRSLAAARIVNCTGPQTDIARSAEPLLRTLVADGMVRTGPLRLGLEIDDALRVTDAAGRPQPRLFAIGPITRERFWEVVAVPDIRHQAVALAATLAGI